MDRVNILVLGGGAREHALAWKIRQSSLCGELWIAPGNAGTASCGTNLDLEVNDFAAIRTACLDHEIHLVVPGPEEPLVLGIADFFQSDPALTAVRVIGPSKNAARLEGSKAFAKAFMTRQGIPTATYAEFGPDNYAQGVQYIRSHALPIVLKADGLAAGKGVLICKTAEEALEGFEGMVHGGQFGEAGLKVVVEQFLSGMELSVFLLCDGRDWVILPEAKDYKRIGEGDKGPNTGGMGAVSPVPFATPEFMGRVRERIIRPTMAGLSRERIPYKGFLFFGLIDVDGDPYTIEYNCRLGDPETEVVLPRLENDLVELLVATAEGRLKDFPLRTSLHAAVTTVLASGGYPGPYPKGLPITGLPPEAADRFLFHGGTRLVGGKVVTNGGRVLAASALGGDISEAARLSRELAGQPGFEGKYFRKDIGHEFY